MVGEACGSFGCSVKNAKENKGFIVVLLRNSTTRLSPSKGVIGS